MYFVHRCFVLWASEATLDAAAIYVVHCSVSEIFTSYSLRTIPLYPCDETEDNNISFREISPSLEN